MIMGWNKINVREGIIPKLVNRYLALENRMLKQQLEWRQKADFANWWNKVKDIPLM